jgi:type II secretory pathway component PulF
MPILRRGAGRSSRDRHMSELTFRYQAATGAGAMESGRIAAPTRADASARLAARGLHPIALTEVVGSWRRRGSLPIGELAIALRLLADLLEAGLPLMRALQTLETVVTPRVVTVLPALIGSVREGGSLARALDNLDVAIPGDVLGVIRAGERGSALAAAVRQAADLSEDAAATRTAVRSALAYPIILATAGTASLGLLVGLVLPRFAAILKDLGQSLPPSTRFVLGAGQEARVLAIPTAVVSATIAVCWRAWVATESGRRQWDGVLLSVPLLGDARAAAATSRFAASLSALLSTGVPMGAALNSASSATGDAAITARVLAARDDVEQGSRLSDALARNAAATPIVQRLARAGEESGRQAPMLAHAARLERARVLRLVQSTVRLIEPAMIVCFGGVVALVAAALLQALYSVRPT